MSEFESLWDDFVEQFFSSVRIYRLEKDKDDVGGDPTYGKRDAKKKKETTEEEKKKKLLKQTREIKMWMGEWKRRKRRRRKRKRVLRWMKMRKLDGCSNDEEKDEGSSCEPDTLLMNMMISCFFLVCFFVCHFLIHILFFLTVIFIFFFNFHFFCHVISFLYFSFSLTFWSFSLRIQHSCI
jgi:K+-sensing histidine kinase KdpD